MQKRNSQARRRGSNRKAEHESGQGRLFDDLPAPAEDAESQAGRSMPDASSEPGGLGEAKKSRSKKRRERRKAAKSAEASSQPPPVRSAEAGPKDSASAPLVPKQRSPKQGGGAPARGGHALKEAGSRPANRSSRAHSSEAQKERRHVEARERRRSRPDGLPAFSPEDIAAVSGYEYTGGRDRGRPYQAPAGVRKLETLSPSSESIAALTALEGVLEEAAPLSPKHRAGLRGDIRQLWEELTSDRESRSADYLGTPQALSAYLRYFLPWNIYRLVSLLTSADFCLPDKAVIVDIGSGPLTLPISLWIARPELRDVNLTIYCMDRVERAMEAGRTIFETLCMRREGKLPPWRIETLKDSFGSPIPERAHLLTAANVFNEFFWRDKRALGERALDTARTLLSYLRVDGSLFVMEPGDPRSGAFIAALRAALIAEGAPPLGPCPHALSCPMPGIFRHLLPPEETRTVRGDPNVAPSRFVLPQVVMPKRRDKYPWCHFGIDAIQAPAWLSSLSEEAGLPKERAVLSYLWAARGASARVPVGMPDALRSADRERHGKGAGRSILVRVVSEPFALPDGSSGQYACSSLGYTLIKRRRGEESFDSGDLIEAGVSPSPRSDDKSGAIVIPT